jgi:dTDP-4-amino-4,6-dideoxygalactose transaminase
VVPVVALDRKGSRIADQFADAARRVSCSGVVLLGPETQSFEGEFSAWTGGLHTVAVSSGASALQLALAGLGVVPGDEVIVPAFTAVPTAAAVCALGATPVFVDVEANTANLDPKLVAAARTPRTRAVIVVHLYGRPANLPDTDLPIVEDAAQAHGAVSHNGRSAAVAYSFYPTKNLGGIGDGGAVVTDDEALADQVRTRRAHGMRSLYVHETVSQNFRMSELEAAWLRLCLPRLTEDNQRRRDIAARYRAVAPQLAWQAAHPRHVYHLCVFRSAQRDSVRSQLEGLGVATSVQYPLSLDAQPAYAHFAGQRTFPHANQWAQQCISVPCVPELTDEEVEHVANALTQVGR